jgi:hypothetical protein
MDEVDSGIRGIAWIVENQKLGPSVVSEPTGLKILNGKRLSGVEGEGRRKRHRKIEARSAKDGGLERDLFG